MIDTDKLIKEYEGIKCPYIFKKNIEQLISDKQDRIFLENDYTLKEFLESNQFRELENKYSFGNLKFTINGLAGNQFICNIKDKKIYDKDMNEIIIPDENKTKYIVGKVVNIICPNDKNFKGVTLKKYIEIIEGAKEFHIYLHELTIDYKYNMKVYIIFGENKTIVLDYDELELIDGDIEFEQKITNINLMQE